MEFLFYRKVRAQYKIFLKVITKVTFMPTGLTFFINLRLFQIAFAK